MLYAEEALWKPATSEYQTTTLQLQPSGLIGNETALSSIESAYSTRTSAEAVKPIHILPHPSPIMDMPPIALSAAGKLKRLKRKHMY